MKSVITQIRPANAKRALSAIEDHLRCHAVGNLSGDALVADVLKRARKNKTTHLVEPFAELYVTLIDALDGQNGKKKSPGLILIA